MAAPSHMRKNRKKYGEEKPVSMASMMDMMTIILLFLLKSYSAQGLLVTEVDGIKLPDSSSDKNPREELSILVDSGRLSGSPGVYLIEEGARTQLLVDGPTLQATEGGGGDSMMLPGLRSFLENKRNEALEMEKTFGIEFKGEIVIQADKETEYNPILKVLYTCGQNEFTKTEFVIIKPKG
jgi:biopolymer transport protein ExbD